MSSSRQFSDGRRLEKPNFVQTCNLLSRYIKEKGSLRVLKHEIGGSTHWASDSTTVNILTDKGKSAQQFSKQLPSMAIDSSINTVKHTSCKLTGKTVTAMDSSNSQLTNIDSGRVLEFDDCPAEKKSSEIYCGILSNAFTVTSTSRSRKGLPPRPPKYVGISSNTCKEKTNAATVGGRRITPLPEIKINDLPIKRRSSLQRFLEKRKAWAAAMGPSQQVQEQPASSSKRDQQLELKL